MNHYIIILTMIACLLLQACSSDTSTSNDTPKADKEKEMVSATLDKAGLTALTPDKILSGFKAGNKRYMSNDLTGRDFQKQISQTTGGQFPEAVILSCIDSRVPVEYIFDKGVGDVFVARVAGNVVDEGILGSMEYACAVAGSKVVLVMGHEHCGAVKAAVDDVKVENSNINPLLAMIRPSVESVEYEGDRTSKNKVFVAKCVHNNVERTISEIRKRSPILKGMEDKGEIKIVGAVYDLDNGEVKYLN